MASIDDAIFLMDDEVVCDPVKKPINSTTTKKAEQGISKSLPGDTIIMLDIAKSPPIDIIQPDKKKFKHKAEFVPSSPYSTI
jgi:hypothetical protein